MDSPLERIIRKTGRKPISCKCQECKKQCSTPCLATPQDIEKIMDAGFADKILPAGWAVGIILGVTPHVIPMLQLEQTPTGCVFFKDGLCGLHDLGLKPTEGKLSHHTQKVETFTPHKNLTWNVAKEWINPDNTDVIERIIDKKIIAEQNG